MPSKLDLETRRQLTNLQDGEELSMSHAECAICFDKLSSRSTCVFTNGTPSCEGSKLWSRVCRHFFHLDCASELLDAKCPLCKTPFQNITVVPNPELNADLWFDIVDFNRGGTLSKQEVLDVFEAQIPLDSKKLEDTLNKMWTRWDTDASGEIDKKEMLDPKNGLLAFVLKARGLRIEESSAGRGRDYGKLPLLREKEAFFAFWDEDGSGELEKGEVVRAIIKTFNLEFIDFGRVAAIRSVIYAIWDIFDDDGSGGISREEFLRYDGLAETLLAQLEHGL